MRQPTRHWLPGVLECMGEDEIGLDIPMAAHCTVRVGGKLAALSKPRSMASLLALLRFLHKENVAFFILGKGANLLLGDKGFDGVAISLSNMPPQEEVKVLGEGGELQLSAGQSISRLLGLALGRGLVGAEFLAGIPGTLGGACAVNAGTRQGDYMSLVSAVELATAEGVGWVGANQLPYGYRHTQLPPHSIAVALRFALPKGDIGLAKRRMREELAYRKRTQPLEWPSFGSVFRNPKGHRAGQLIDAAGLKGTRCGGAQISTKHANWIINRGAATALDILRLMEMAMVRVEAQYGIKLTPEVHQKGVFE
ncbi:MAG: UDP-N-acetylmuramate dehydrogenase [Proteobacteria bacterium]|nr:UDP-N-acetylmuramate dehydrogenase [Cystobacterineae bacterium]MCL2258731.1 UDP-N-acetylmuramate dehydrogenase [Cystobacterineae bacterium]MCL2314279.1 UDP-N-acetylmuramate dehydrogenase [Pseudomonadota bacterium]